jgi:hypothetical protein
MRKIDHKNRFENLREDNIKLNERKINWKNNQFD